MGRERLLDSSRQILRLASVGDTTDFTELTNLNPSSTLMMMIRSCLSSMLGHRATASYAGTNKHISNSWSRK